MTTTRRGEGEKGRRGEGEKGRRGERATTWNLKPGTWNTKGRSGERAKSFLSPSLRRGTRKQSLRSWDCHFRNLGIAMTSARKHNWNLRIFAAFEFYRITDPQPKGADCKSAPAGLKANALRKHKGNLRNIATFEFYPITDPKLKGADCKSAPAGWAKGRQPATRIYHLQFIIHHSSFIIYHLPFTIYHLQFIIYHLPFTIYNLQFIIYHLPFTIYHLPFTIYHLPFTIQYRLVMAWNTDNTDVNNADFHLNPFLSAFENPHHLRLVEMLMA